jgi:type VI secretion system secreted protein VgrG
MLLASPSGVALSTQQSVHVSSDQQTNLVSGQSVFIASGKSLVASVAEKISLFVQNAGMKLFAAKGKVEVQAHSDNIELTAQKTVKVVSATENIEAAAKQEILLTSGGAYIRIKDGNIEIHAPGKIDIKGAQHSFAGPAQTQYPLPALPLNHLYDRPVWVVDERGFSVPDRPIRVHLKNGQTITGKTDHDGVAQLAISDEADILRVEILKKLMGKNV